MNKLFSKKIILYFVIVLFIFLADRISKLYILSILENVGNVNININSYINFILVWNSGIGFGLLSFDQSQIYNLITALIVFINLLIVYLKTPGIDGIDSFLFDPSITNIGKIKSLGLKVFSWINFRDHEYFLLRLSLKAGYFPVIII